MKACIKEYNATLPAPVKTSGSRDALLEQLAIINPDLVAQEAQKPQPLKVSGTKADLIQAVKSVNRMPYSLTNCWMHGARTRKAKFWLPASNWHGSGYSESPAPAPYRRETADPPKPRR
jgi:hypothetical protein